MIQKKKESNQETELDELKKKFDEVKGTGKFRKVTLNYKACCGCGCYDVPVERTVPENSPFKNGDRITKLENGDKPLD